MRNSNYKRSYRIILLILSTLFIAGFNIMISFILQMLIDNVLSKTDIFLIATLLGLLLFVAVIYPVLYSFNIKLSKKIDLENREHIINDLILKQLNMDLLNQERIKEADYIMLFNDDLDNYVPLSQHFITIIIALLYGFFYSYKVSFAVILFVILYHIVNNSVFKCILRKKENYLNSVSNSKQFLYNFIENIPIFRVVGLKEQSKYKIGNYLSEELSQKKIISKFEIINNISGEQMIQGIEFAVFLIGLYFNLKGEISFGVVVGLWNGLIGSILWSSVEIPYVYQQLSSAISSEKRIKKFLDIESQKIFTGKFDKSNFKHKKISISQLAYQFNEAGEKIKYKDMVFGDSGICLITGKSGVGKSTLAKLLSELYVPSEGKIFKNKGEVYYIPQGHEIFPLSIRDNIKLGQEELTDSEIYNVLSEVGLMETFISETRTLDTIIETGKISGGEAQRIGIARSIIRKSQYIIMDEPFANLDYSNSINLVKLIKKLSCSHSFIIITHVFLEEFQGCKVYTI